MGEPGITVITPTGARPEAFALAEQYMQTQAYRGPLQWIVVDDGPIPTICQMDQTVVRRTPVWQPGQNTLVQNLLAALPLVAFDHIVFWEDDDYYAPTWLETCWARLESGADLVGERNTKYYYVPMAQYRIMGNAFHSSLFQTALSSDLLPTVEAILRRSPKLFDVELWKYVLCKCRKPLLLDKPTLGAVGMKGLPGRVGIGVGHQPTKPGWTVDPEGQTLWSWLGSAAGNYRRWWNGSGRVGVRNISVERADAVSLSGMSI